MSTIGDIVSVGGLLLSSISVVGTVEEASEDPFLESDYVQRADAAPEFIASTVAPLNKVLIFSGIDTYEKQRTVIRALNYPRTDTTFRVVAYVGDSSAPTSASIDCTLTSIRKAHGSVIANVTSPGGVWSATDLTTLGPYTFTQNGAIPLVSDGEATTQSTIKLAWTTQRTTQTADVGWKYRRQFTVTNNTDRNWRDRPHCVDLGDTSAWVTGTKAQSDGDDVRVRIEGKEKYRTLVNFNTARTFCWFLVSLNAGDSVTVDVVYGNSAATTPRNLSTRTATRQTYVAFDLEGIAGTATAGAASTLSTGVSMESHRWRGGFIQITSGTGSGQRRRIASHTSGGVITVERAWTTTPDNTSVYVIWRSGVMVNGGAASAGSTTTLTDASQAFRTNELQGGYLWNVTKGIGPFLIASNTATVITTATMTAPAVSDVYYVEKYGAQIYNTNPNVFDPAHLDLWRRNTYYSKPTRIWFGNQTPGGWQPTLYLDNGDDFAQSRVYDIGSGGGHGENWRGHGRARRSRSQDNTYPEEGQADGVSVYAPEAYQGIYFDYQLKNESGVGKFVLSVLDPGGEEWRDVVTDSTTYASLGAGSVAAQYVDLSTDENPTRLYMGVLPADGVAIPTTVAITEEIEFRNYLRTELFLDVTGIGGLTNGIFSVGSEENIYDVAVTFRIGGGADGDQLPYDECVIGGTDHYLHLTADEELWISTDENDNRPLAGVYEDDALVYPCPWAIRIYRHEADNEGTDQALVARALMPITPRTNLLTNPTFETNLTGWGDQEDSDVGVTATWSRDAGVYYDAAGSLKCIVSAAPAFVWTSFYKITAPLTLVDVEHYDIAIAYRTTNTDLQINLGYDDGVTYADTLVQSVAATGTWYPLAASMFGAPSFTLWVGVAGGSGDTGTVYFDALVFGNYSLYVTESAMGTITVQVEFRDRYLL